MLVIRCLDELTLAALQATAAQNGRCLDAEIASILAAHLNAANASGLGTPGPHPDAVCRCSGAARNDDEVALRRAPILEPVRTSPVCGMKLSPAPRPQLERVGSRKCDSVAPMKSGLRMLLDIRAD